MNRAARGVGAVEVADVLVLVLLFLAAANAFQYWFYFAFFALLVLIIFNKLRIKVGFLLFSLIGFSLSMAIFWSEGHITFLSTIKQFIYPATFLVGYSLIVGPNSTLPLGSTQARERRLIAILCAVCLGFFFHYLLNFSLNSGLSSRSVVDFWSRSVLSATGQAAIACLPVGLFCGFLFSDMSRKVKAIGLVGLVFVLLYNLVLAGRTIIVLIILVLLVGYSYRMLSGNAKHKFRNTIAVVAFSFAAMMAFQQNLFGIQDAILGSNLFNRFQMMGVSEDGRMTYKIQHLMLMMNYPFGGNNILNLTGGYAHDFLLDIYDAGGLFAFLFAVAMLASSISLLYAFLKHEDYSIGSKTILLCVMCSVYIEFFVEPIVYGMPWLLAHFCLILGLVAGCNKVREAKIDA